MSNTAETKKNPFAPYSRDPKEICRDSIEHYATTFRKLLDHSTVPSWELELDLSGIDPSTCSVACLDDLIYDIVQFRDALKEFISDNELPQSLTPSCIEDMSGKFCLNGDVYEDAVEYINSNFLDFGYHRYHGDINVLQFLTHFGGPAGGFWMNPDESWDFWTAWWGAPTTVEVSQEDVGTIREFFAIYLEGRTYSFDDCPHDMFNCEDQEGLEGAVRVLQSIEASKSYIPDNEDRD